MAWFKKDRKTETGAPVEPVVKTPEIVTKHGTYCRTCAFVADPAIGPEYLEAYQQPGSNHLWNVTEIRIGEKGGKTVMHARPLDEGVEFLDAVKRLSAFEYSKPLLPGEHVGPSREELDAKHFKTFAEREGVIFDSSGAPCIPPHPDAVPAGHFNEDDLESARANREAAENAPKAEDPDFLSKAFNSVCHDGNLEEVLNGLETLGKLDEFLKHIDGFRTELQSLLRNPTGHREVKGSASPDRLNTRQHETRTEYPDPFESHYGYERPKTYTKEYAFEKAATRLDHAYMTINGMDDTESLVKTLHRFDVMAHILWAQALFDTSCREDGDKSWYVNKIKGLEENARAICAA